MTYAFDRSLRNIDADGRLHVARTPISKATVNPYIGKEIPGYVALGLDPYKIYKMFRDPDELAKAAPTFARLPILSKHSPITAVAHKPELVVGAIGSDVEFSGQYLCADICVWDSAAIAGIESDVVRELSCSYHYVPVMEPGVFEGQAYDGRMTEIRGNHLALVDVGRAGPDVFVADANPFKTLKKETAMQMTKPGRALFAALCAASPVLAADSALPALVGNANRKTFDAKDIKSKLLALDANLDPQQLDNVVDSILEVEQEPTPVETPAAVVEESPSDKIKSLLAGKVDDAIIEQILTMLTPAADAAPEEVGMKPEEVKTAMDSLRREMREAEEARRDVRVIVGDVLGMDSAAEVYAFALDTMKVDHDGIADPAALRALFRVASAKPAPAPRVAQDSAGLATKLPAALRFRSV